MNNDGEISEETSENFKTRKSVKAKKKQEKCRRRCDLAPLWERIGKLASDNKREKCNSKKGFAASKTSARHICKKCEK